MRATPNQKEHIFHELHVDQKEVPNIITSTYTPHQQRSINTISSFLALIFISSSVVNVVLRADKLHPSCRVGYHRVDLYGHGRAYLKHRQDRQGLTNDHRGVVIYEKTCHIPIQRDDNPSAKTCAIYCWEIIIWAL